MARNRRVTAAIQRRTAARREKEDALLAAGSFQGIDQETNADFDVLSKGTETRKKRRSSWSEVEQEYELRPRKMANTEDDLVEGLPIKVNGKIERKLTKREAPKATETEEASEESEEEEENEAESEGLRDVEGETLEEDTEERILQLKEEIAELVEKIMENPEENTEALTKLCTMADSANPNTCKFSMLALVPVFTSIIPGYRIRPLTELEKKERVSKDVARLRKFEENLVHNYKNYVELLKRLSRVPNSENPIKVNLGVLAMQAANRLAFNASHFNFRGDIVAILVRRVCKPNLSVDPVAGDTIKTIESLFNGDDEGNISVEIMRTLSKVVKVRNYNIDESVLNMLLSLDVLQDYDPHTRKEEAPEAQMKMKVKKKDRVYLTKKQRKARKEMRDIEEEMRKAELAVSAEERERNQAEILRLVFSLYLNILRQGRPTLIGSVLEGLAKFGNMVNLDLLGDFLTVMKEIIQMAELDDLSAKETRKVLLCIVSAFSLVSNNSGYMKINVDLSAFVDALYAILFYVALDADIELSHKSFRLADPLNDEFVRPAVNVSTTAELLLKALDHVFFRTKSGSKERAASFTKRLYMCMLYTPEKTSIALLKFVDKLMSKYPEITGLYSTDDRIGNGEFNMETNNISHSNVGAATLWEDVILAKHYCPTVKRGLKNLDKRSIEHAR